MSIKILSTIFFTLGSEMQTSKPLSLTLTAAMTSLSLSLCLSYEIDLLK